jgi:hypothetical protein
VTEPQHIVAITGAEVALLDIIRDEPMLVENLRRCTAAKEHERQMLERLRIRLIRAAGAQRAAALNRPSRAD